MKFNEYYNNLLSIESKRAFRKDIINLCKIEHSTFYTWLNRDKVPLLAQEVISKFIDRPQSELFPTETEK